MRTSRPTAAALAVVGLVAAAGSAFTAANTDTPIASAGYEGTATSGFAVSAVKYELGDGGAAGGDKGNDVDTVEFTLTPSNAAALGAQQARVRLVKADAGPPVVAEGGYYDCTTTDTDAGTTNGVVTFTCDVTTAGAGVEAADINTLDIVAVSQPKV